MGKKRSIPCLIGGILILGNIIELLNSYVLPWKTPDTITTFELFLNSASLFPTGFSALYALIRYDISVYFLIVLWQMIIVLCGIGIILLKNIARRVFVVMCCVEVCIFFLAKLAFLFIYDLPWSSPPFILKVINHLSWIFPVVYIFLLTRPEVKAQFSPGQGGGEPKEII